MQNFEFYSPTEIIFGKGSEEQTGKQIIKHGGSRVFVVHGSSVVKTGALDRIIETLKAEGLEYELCGGITPNPRLSFAREAVKKAITFNTDFVLAIGGGSVIDTAKAVADGVANPETDIWEFWTEAVKLTKALPVGVVLTLSASGSETSNSAVLTNEETGQKIGFNLDLHRPQFAIMNPEFTFTLPKYQIGCGVADIMMHTLDRYFTITKDNDMTDGIAEALLKNVIKHGRTAINNPSDYVAASELMWAGSLSHNGITGLGAVTDFAPHQLGHEVSAWFDVAHGASLTAIWGAWATYTYPTDVARFAQYGRNVWGITEGSDEDIALAAIDATVDYFRFLEMPVSFSEVAEIGSTVGDEVLNEFADRITRYGKRPFVGGFKKLYRDDAYEIYQMSNK